MRRRVALMRLQHLYILFGIVTALLLGACAKSERATTDRPSHATASWGYEAGNGPRRWSSMDPAWTLCEQGVEQSPIDLTKGPPAELPAIVIDTPSEEEVLVRNQEGVVDALDNGHTIQVNANGGAALIIGAKTFSLVQFHFHAPSEHTLDGRHLPMEAHFVHQAEDGTLAVLGVLIERGVENAALAPIWAQLAEADGKRTTLRISPAFADQFFVGEESGVYHYQGSLTTPPCSEDVHWYIRRTPTELSGDQISAFTAVHDRNNRPVQPLGDRSLFLDEKPDVRID